MVKDSEGDFRSKEKGECLLGDFVIAVDRFENLKEVFKSFETPVFLQFNLQKKKEKINEVLCKIIQKTPTPCFLLPALLNFLEELDAQGIVQGHDLHDFEWWLNQFSNLNFEENYLIRSKIAGKYIPRDAYQTLFPIGMEKVYPGSHFVTAHGSPDLDTTISSFWGWMDAFAARVSEGLHLWNVPGGAPEAPVEMNLLFYEIFGNKVIDFIAKTRTTLSLSATELMTQKGVIKTLADGSTFAIDHDGVQNAVILIDQQGYYLGDWRHFDVEGVQGVILLLSNCLIWFTSHLQTQLISFFAKENPNGQEACDFIQVATGSLMKDSQPAKEFTAKQREQIDCFLMHVLNVPLGLNSTYKEFSHAVKQQGIEAFDAFIELIESLPNSPLFSKNGSLIENRPQIFHQLEKMIGGLNVSMQELRSYMEKFEVALKIKSRVLQQEIQFASFRDDVEEIRSKMGYYSYLTVTAMTDEEKLLPLGVIHSYDLHKPILGTVSLRDFCNREETKIPAYLEVISVIDHHKSSLQTVGVPLAAIADAQSSNVLCAELSFGINDSFSLGGMKVDQIESELKTCVQEGKGLEQVSVMQRLLKRWTAKEKRGGYFIHPQREFIEYLHFLFGIFDDTDLLTKVSHRDLECVVELINRMKSLLLKKEIEVLSLSDLPHDRLFIAKAAKRILQHEDVYSLYKKIYAAKEEVVNHNITLAAKQESLALFADTKVQNGCVRIGQAKLFSCNHSLFLQNADQLRKVWYENLLDFWQQRIEVDLHLQMISTVASAEDLYRGQQKGYDHLDELWIAIPFNEQSIEHLKGFLNGFKTCPQMMNSKLSVTFYGKQREEYEEIFLESFLPIEKRIKKESETVSMAVLSYPAGSLNSRKAMISPYCPKI